MLRLTDCFYGDAFPDCILLIIPLGVTGQSPAGARTTSYNLIVVSVHVAIQSVNSSSESTSNKMNS